MFMSIAVLLAGCGQQSQKADGKTGNSDALASSDSVKLPRDVKALPFDTLFRSIQPEDISESLFKLVGRDFTVITAGSEADYNSMTASWGGWGILFNQPTTWAFLRANRYTLEYIRREKIYTMAYFTEPYKEQVLLFGSSSGRDSDKMKKHTLTPVKTPSGSIAYKEAKLIIECALTEITTVSPDDYFTDEGRKFVVDAHNEVKDWHKLVFGRITGVWKATE